VRAMGYRDILNSAAEEVCSTLSGQPVELKMSVLAHVFFSCEGRMKVVKTSVRESVMLPIGAASCLL